MTQQLSPKQEIGTQSSMQSQTGQQPSQTGQQSSQTGQQPSQIGQGGQQQWGQIPEGSQGYTQGAQSTTGGGRIQISTQGGSQMLQGSTSAQHGLRLDDALTNEMRVALHDFAQAANVTEWCAEQCIDEGPQMAECIRLCRDVADLAEMNVKFMTRDSAFGPDLVDVFVQAADACARECAQHSHSHCQECVDVLSRSIVSAEEMLASFQGGGQGGTQAMMGSQPTQTTGGQSMPPQSGQPTQSMGPSQPQQRY